MKNYSSKGTICVRGNFDLVYALCEIEYIANSDNTFKYIFRPNYSVIDLLTSEYFQGIPGLNLDLRKDEYIRDNKTPTFISERVPSTNREDYYILLEKLNMEYMDPIKYLILTNEQYSGDKLFVIEKKEKETVTFDSAIYDGNNNVLIKNILINICLGNDVKIGREIVNDLNRKSFHDVFLAIYRRSLENRKKLQRLGIEKAKAKGVYKGRKPIKVDTLMFLDYLEKVRKKEMTARQAAIKLGISIDKYYRTKKLLQN